jgi:crotonobetainyl-CoA:carnitine CoA-transferase CaiB-like acyl-CoA transferase
LPTIRRLQRSQAQRNEARIEAALSAWTRTRPVEAIEAELQQLGIPVHRLLNTNEVSVDPQLVHRGYCLRIAHPQPAPRRSKRVDSA